MWICTFERRQVSVAVAGLRLFVGLRTKQPGDISAGSWTKVWRDSSDVLKTTRKTHRMIPAGVNVLVLHRHFGLCCFGRLFWYKAYWRRAGKGPQHCQSARSVDACDKPDDSHMLTERSCKPSASSAAHCSLQSVSFCNDLNMFSFFPLPPSLYLTPPPPPSSSSVLSLTHFLLLPPPLSHTTRRLIP